MGLAELRKHRNLTQRELAKLADVSNVNIAQYERGTRNPRNMTLDTAIRLADALKLRDLRKLLEP